MNGLRTGSGRQARGFSMITAIFLLVVLSALGGFMVVFVSLQQNTIQADVQGVRAYYAARAGINWGLYRALDPDNTIAPAQAAFPGCPAGTISGLGGTLAAFNVFVTCTATTPDATEGSRTIRVYTITATACNQPACVVAPAVPPTGYVERRVVVTVAKCKDQAVAAVAPYRCGI